MSQTLKTALELTTQPYALQLEQVHIEFTRAQAMLQNVVAELESDLDRMRNNDKVPMELIEKKDSQIEMIIRFNDCVDSLFSLYKLTTINQRAELVATNMMLWDALKSKNTAFETLMHRLVTVPKQKQA
jgi:hypothetical protein